MPWNKNIPNANDKLSNFPVQAQANWDYLQTTLDIDHRFTTTADPLSGTDGHHKFIQMPTTAAAPVLGAGMNGELYARTNGAAVGTPGWKISGSTEDFKLPVCISGLKAGLAQGSHTVDLYDFATKTVPTMIGYAQVYVTNAQDKTILSPFVWDSVAPLVTVPGPAGQLVSGVNLIRFLFSGTKLTLVYNYSPGAPFDVIYTIIGHI